MIHELFKYVRAEARIQSIAMALGETPERVRKALVRVWAAYDGP